METTIFYPFQERGIVPQSAGEKGIPMATIKDVARMAGVSIATVSRVMKGARNVLLKAFEVVNLAM